MCDSFDEVWGGYEYQSHGAWASLCDCAIAAPSDDGALAWFNMQNHYAPLISIHALDITNLYDRKQPYGYMLRLLML